MGMMSGAMPQVSQAAQQSIHPGGPVGQSAGGTPSGPMGGMLPGFGGTAGPMPPQAMQGMPPQGAPLGMPQNPQAFQPPQSAPGMTQSPQAPQAMQQTMSAGPMQRPMQPGITGGGMFGQMNPMHEMLMNRYRMGR